MNRLLLASCCLAGLAYAEQPAKSQWDKDARTTQAAGYISAFDDTFPHIAFGGPWTTKFTVINFRTAAVRVPISFFNDDGDAISLSIGGRTVSSLTLNLSPLGKAVVETDYQPDKAPSSGLARLNIPCVSLDSCGNVGGYAVFKWQRSGQADQEAVVQAAPSLQQRVFVSFDEQNGYFTGIALTHPEFVSTSDAAITVVARDGGGSRILIDQISLPANGHTSFLLSQKYPQLKGLHGTVEFSTTDYVAALALVFNPTGAFTSSPMFSVDQ